MALLLTTSTHRHIDALYQQDWVTLEATVAQSGALIDDQFMEDLSSNLPEAVPP